MNECVYQFSGISYSYNQHTVVKTQMFKTKTKTLSSTTKSHQSKNQKHKYITDWLKQIVTHVTHVIEWCAGNQHTTKTGKQGFINTNFVTKINNQKTKTKTLKNESSRPRIKCREPQL